MQSVGKKENDQNGERRKEKIHKFCGRSSLVGIIEFLAADFSTDRPTQENLGAAGGQDWSIAALPLLGAGFAKQHAP